MKACNVEQLEHHLASDGWAVTAENFVLPDQALGVVQASRYKVDLTAPTGRIFTATAGTRADACAKPPI